PALCHNAPAAIRPTTGRRTAVHRTEQAMSIFDVCGHEEVVFCHDPDSGLRAVIAIHSTALGPALGGTRFHPYATEEEAVADVLHLAEGMSYKNAIAGLDHGGGKAVIWGDPAADKSEALLRAYGRFVETLGGRYATACDGGTYVEDMDVVARETRYVTGHSPENGGAGDSSILTSFGVFQAMRAAAAHRWGEEDLSGRTVGVAGLGKVGRHRRAHLLRAPRLRPLRTRRGAERGLAEDPRRRGRLRRGEQPARRPGRGRGARPGGDPLLPGLRGQLRRGDPGRRGVRRGVRLQARRAAHGAGLRHVRAHSRPGQGRGRHTGGRRRRDRRGADGRGRPPAAAARLRLRRPRPLAFTSWNTSVPRCERPKPPLPASSGGSSRLDRGCSVAS